MHDAWKDDAVTEKMPAPPAFRELQAEPRPPEAEPPPADPREELILRLAEWLFRGE